ncbi:hypothetical protein KXD40_001171 [Peronospora effusa]|uniref:Uncharacterized protein n=1 Tax=Peronospora effusa TaxID=542832 RepID=A0A3M6VTC3_9STRA|nr:hypothetical protein DD238_002221 [Peronospora effusa]RQM15165.1 hypothetical protein DD237_005842 [Peronospora effusa]UIZ21519.1 hypothetical protein KXD40_001171 [Peronospora effusa]
MATRHGKRNRCPVRNALLKWQLQQDEQRVAEVQHRLMRMATPSSSSSLEINSSSFDRQLAAQRPRPMHDTDQDEAMRMTCHIRRDVGKRKRDTDFQDSKCEKFVSSLRAKDRDHHQVFDNTLVYGTKASRTWNESSIYGNEKDRCPFPMNVDINDDGMLPSELSTMSINEQTNQSITQHGDMEALATDANDYVAPISGQSIAEMLASMENSSQVEYGGDWKVCDDQHYEVSNGGDQSQFSVIDSLFARMEVFFGMKFPWRSMIVIACCLVIGTSGFFIEEVITLLGLFSRRPRFVLSRAEQERIRDRMSVLQLELQGFQLFTSTIEVRSQTVLTELRQYMNMMRLDREKHQDILAKEMQKLRRHIVHVTHELVEQERESLRAQLEDIIKVQVIDIEGVDDNGLIVKATDAENDKQLDKTTTGTPIQVEPLLTMQESLHDAIASSPASACEVNGDQFSLTQTEVELSHEPVTKDDAAVTFVQNPRTVDNEQAQVVCAESGHGLVGVPSPSTTGELVNVQHSEIKSESPIFVQEVHVEHPVKVESASLPVLEQSLNKIDDTIASTVEETINVIPSRNAFGVSWDERLLLMGIVFLAACVVLRAYNIHRRKRWFEERRARRNRRALRLAQRRARAMAEYRKDRDEWHGDETDGDIEEVSLMTPI